MRLIHSNTIADDVLGAGEIHNGVVEIAGSMDFFGAVEMHNKSTKCLSDIYRTYRTFDGCPQSSVARTGRVNPLKNRGGMRNRLVSIRNRRRGKMPPVVPPVVTPVMPPVVTPVELSGERSIGDVLHRVLVALVKGGMVAAILANTDKWIGKRKGVKG